MSSIAPKNWLYSRFELYSWRIFWLSCMYTIESLDIYCLFLSCNFKNKTKFIIGHLRGAGTGEVFPIGGENKTALKQLVGGSQGYRVYDPKGVSCTLQSQAGGGGAKTGLYLTDAGSKINVVGNLSTEGQRGQVFSTDGIIGALTASDYKGPMKVLIRPCLTPDRISKRQNGRRFKENGESMFTLTAQDTHGVLIAKTIRCGGRSSPIGSKQNWDTYKINGKIRRLTPLECWRLQGFADEQFYKARDVNSDSQLYKQAGNSVTVNVIYEIAKRLS